jgi:dihydropteroate synthase
MDWQLAQRSLNYTRRTLVMGVLNVTPDSFSDGGQFSSTGGALARALEMLEEGADILDIGGESTRPGAGIVSAAEEIERVVPVIEHLAKRVGIPLSIDTTKAEVARAALRAGAEIINDVSGLRFDAEMARAAADARAGLILMHSRGESGSLHGLEPVEDIFREVTESLRGSVEAAESAGVKREAIALDPGIGFGKSQEQNVELIARFDLLADGFQGFPLLIGTSRKSFLGRLLHGAPVNERLHATMATLTAAVLGGAHIVRVHAVRAAVETVRVADAIRRAGASETPI